jgi:beta propeller repeat protein
MKEAIIYVRAYALVLCMSFGAFALSIQVSTLFKPGIATPPLLYDGKVCIEDFVQGSYRLRLVDASSGTAQELRNNVTAYLWPLAYGGTYAAWIGYSTGGGGGGGGSGAGGIPISYYVQTINAANKTEVKIVENIYYIERLVAAANRVVWTDYRYFTTSDTTIEIYLYDFSSGSERRITSRKGYKSAPYIMGNQIVWQDYRNATQDGKNADIYLYDLSAGQEKTVCTYSAYQDQPSVYNNIVVWQDYRNAGSDQKNADIYMRDLSTGTERAICTAPGYQAYPRIYGNIIVWQDYRNATPSDTSNADIYLYDLATSTEMAVTTKTGYQSEPFFYGSTIVWFDYTDNTIYKAALNITSVNTSIASSISRCGNAHGNLVISASSLGQTNDRPPQSDILGRRITLWGNQIAPGAYVKQ